MSKVTAILLNVQMLVTMTRPLLVKFLKLYKILWKQVTQNTVNTTAAENYKNRSQLFNISPSARTRETADLIYLLSLEAN